MPKENKGQYMHHHEKNLGRLSRLVAVNAHKFKGIVDDAKLDAMVEWRIGLVHEQWHRKEEADQSTNGSRHHNFKPRKMFVPLNALPTA